MKSIARMALKDGMVLACDVYSYQKTLIASEGDVINSALIAKLARHSIMCVDIKEPKDFVSTRAERIRMNSMFQNFEKVYNDNLNSYKYMILSFLEVHSPVNVSYLLQIHDNIYNCCNCEEQLLDMLCHLKPNKEDFTYAHCLNAALISTVFGKWLKLEEEELQLMTLCGYFYDIGKLYLPDSLVWKQDKLTSEESETLKTHTTLGYDILKNQKLNDIIKKCTLHHHEFVDGSGYPNGLKNNQIDKFSKYISIVDAYETFTFNKNNHKIPTSSQIIRAFEKKGLHKFDSTAIKIILSKIAGAQIGCHP